MRAAVSRADAERFRGIIARELGLHFDDGKLAQLEMLLRRRLAATGRTADDYIADLESDGFDLEASYVCPELTVPETHFFRNNGQLGAFTDVVLPDRMNASVHERRLRILSAGCASGEEPYSIAILAQDAIHAGWDVSILAVDVNPAMVTRATRARYSAWALRDTPQDTRQRWFKPRGKEFVLDDAIRQSVRFEVRNLARSDDALWRFEHYDVVFFRNVFMYFTAEHARQIIARIARALKPCGYLFVGHAETLRNLSSSFELQHTHEAFYYRRSPALDVIHPRLPVTTGGSTFDVTAAEPVEPGDAWIDAIRQATARVDGLGTVAHSPSAVAGIALPSPHASPGVWDLGAAFDLLRAERFIEASAVVHGLPSAAAHDPHVLLLRASLLAHRGAFAEAEEACRRLLDVDHRSAGAHYLIALCREGAHDRPGAVQHHRIAAYLDPGFAMPRLHLGLLARRSGDATDAQRELGRALPLLKGEDGARVLLFGGGFSREALVTLCQTELAACGGLS